MVGRRFLSSPHPGPAAWISPSANRRAFEVHIYARLWLRWWTLAQFTCPKCERSQSRRRSARRVLMALAKNSLRAARRP